MGKDTYYDILGVSRTATTDDIKARYRLLILRIHPDLDGPPALFRQVQEAYEALSDPSRRAAYDRLLRSGGGTGPASFGDPNADWSQRAHPGPANRAGHPGSGSSARRSASNSRRKTGTKSALASWLSRHSAGTVAIAGATLILLGTAFAVLDVALVTLGVVALIVAGLAGLGGRGEKQREAYQRSGMTAVDAMTGRQFEVLLKHFFANKGYRVARVGGRREFGADLLLNDTHGRVLVQARRWSGGVPDDAVEQAVAAMGRYGAARALVVTSSEYSRDVVTGASSNGVGLWSRATLATELMVFRGGARGSGVQRISSEVQAGSRIFLGYVVAVFVTLVASATKREKDPSGTSTP